MAANVAVAEDDTYTRRLVVLFGLVYFAQGLGQHVGIVAQPLTFFFKEALGLDPEQTTDYLAVVTIPWTIKPLYGLVSDFVPLLGYRRKSWLFVANAAATAGFLWLTGLTAPALVAGAMVVTAFGIAAADVIIDAIMVENGNRTGRTAEFQSVQWLWSSVGLVFSSVAGGYLCKLLAPTAALHTAAAVAVLAPLAVMAASWLVVREAPSRLDLAGMQETSRGLVQAFRSPVLWVVVGFLAFWYFSPSFGTPWYYHQVDTLKFTQEFIGWLGAAGSLGSVGGALAYWRAFAHRPLERQLSFGIWTGTIGTLLYILLLEPNGWSAGIALLIELVFGATSMIALLATITLAARACPPRAEGSTFAALTAVTNGFSQISAIVGAHLYTSWLGKRMLPLILISAGFTLACFLLLPILKRAGVTGGKGTP